jgi:hypothetical protein
MVHENSGEHSLACFYRHGVFVVNLDPLHPAAGRIALKDKTANIFFFQFSHFISRETFHPFRHIFSGAGYD